MKSSTLAFTIFLLSVELSVANSHITIATRPKIRIDTIHLYFPLREQGFLIPDSTNALDTFMNVWYSKALTAINEPILANYEGDLEVYRFTWIRTFHPSITIRIEKQGSAIKLYAKVLGWDKNGYQRRLIKEKSKTIRTDDWDSAQSILTSLNFWNLRLNADDRGFDGAEWIVEGSTPERYHFTTIWSPGKTSRYALFCLFLLKLSGIKASPDEVY